MLIPKSDIDTAEQVHALATPGTWSLSRTPHDERPGTYEVCDLVNDLWVITDHDGLSRPEDDGAFIVAAHEQWPAHITALRTLAERAEAVTKLADDLDKLAARWCDSGFTVAGTQLIARADGMRECLRMLRGETLPSDTTPTPTTETP